MDTSDAYRTILDETRHLLAALPHVGTFAELAPDAPDFHIPEARPLAVSAEIVSIAGATEGVTAPLARAIAAASPVLRFEQSFQRTEVGSEFLRHYGWFDLISPEGPFVQSDLRISFTMLGQGLVFPEKQHPSDEIAVVIAGGAVLRQPDCPPVRLWPGHTAEITAGQSHEIDMTDGPRMVMHGWKGSDLMARATRAASA